MDHIKLDDEIEKEKLPPEWRELTEKMRAMLEKEGVRVWFYAIAMKGDMFTNIGTSSAGASDEELLSFMQEVFRFSVEMGGKVMQKQREAEERRRRQEGTA